MDEQAGLENRSPSRDRGFESHPLRHNTKAIPLSVELPYQFIAIYAGGMRTGVLKGVRPLHGVTGATRRREGAWPPSGSTDATLGATSNPHPLHHNVTRRTPEHGAIISVHCRHEEGQLNRPFSLKP